MAASQPAFICASCARSLRATIKAPSTKRVFSSRTPAAAAAAASTTSQYEDRKSIPRWQHTPAAMKMAFPLRTQRNKPLWRSNEDPRVLDDFMDRFVGDAGGRRLAGRDMLPEEIKWLSVTHKSFEQGARGFNDKLAFLGKRILDVQTSKALLEKPVPELPNIREPVDGAMIGLSIKHPALEGVENITAYAKHSVLSPTRIAPLAYQYGLDKVIRWLPRQLDSLQASGIEAVLTHTLYAIVGAIALQQGGQVAEEVAKQRILKPLGL